MCRENAASSASSQKQMISHKVLGAPREPICQGSCLEYFLAINGAQRFFLLHASGTAIIYIRIQVHFTGERFFAISNSFFAICIFKPHPSSVLKKVSKQSTNQRARGVKFCECESTTQQDQRYGKHPTPNAFVEAALLKKNIGRTKTMGNSSSNPTATVAAVAGEETPLLMDDSSSSNKAMLNFRRSSAVKKRPSIDTRSSVRGTGPLFTQEHGHSNLRPVDALSPLVAGAVIVTTDGYKTKAHYPSSVKSLPAFAPFPRRARHRSFALWWLNEFRHWWKSR